jgi:hypothetical protein
MKRDALISRNAFVPAKTPGHSLVTNDRKWPGPAGFQRCRARYLYAVKRTPALHNGKRGTDPPPTFANCQFCREILGPCPKTRPNLVEVFQE